MNGIDGSFTASDHANEAGMRLVVAGSFEVAIVVKARADGADDGEEEWGARADGRCRVGARVEDGCANRSVMPASRQD